MEEAQKKLNGRELVIKESGSIAQAALSLNGIFDTAQRAADDYVNAVKAKADSDCAAARLEAQRLMADAKNKAERLEKEAEEKLSKADENIRERERIFYKTVGDVLASHKELNMLLGQLGNNNYEKKQDERNNSAGNA